jgi:hypothetical protein
MDGVALRGVLRAQGRGRAAGKLGTGSEELVRGGGGESMNVLCDDLGISYILYSSY